MKRPAATAAVLVVLVGAAITGAGVGRATRTSDSDVARGVTDARSLAFATSRELSNRAAIQHGHAEGWHAGKAAALRAGRRAGDRAGRRRGAALARRRAA